MISVEETFRHCPRCGVACKLPPANPFRCSNCDHVHYFSPAAAVGGIVSDGNRVLFLVRNKDPGKGALGLPGGFVDGGESLEQSLVREVAEETSLNVVECRYLCSYPNQYNYRGVSVPVIDMFYACRVEDVNATEIERDEVSDFKWLNPTEDVLDQMAFRSNRLAIEFFLNKKK